MRIGCLRSHWLALPLASLLLSCGGSGSSGSNSPHDGDPQLPGDPQVPDNTITTAYFRDQDAAIGKIAGHVVIQLKKEATDEAAAESLWVYWADQHGNAMGEKWLTVAIDEVDPLSIPSGTSVLAGATGLLLYTANDSGPSEQPLLVRFHDFIGNAELSGPGGNYDETWYYGDDRPVIRVHRDDATDTCVFDNGLVSVVDMANTQDDAWHSSSDGQPNQADDHAYPPYSFRCDQNPVNTFREVSDDVGVWTYSTLNDAMHYGTVVYDMFLKQLGEPALHEKLRLRVHYASRSSQYAYWDGAYGNFSDGYPFHYSFASLDIIAHEISHGVLNRIADMDAFEQEISTDVRTVHEAFADISGVVAKYTMTGEVQWVHGEEANGYVRHLDRIQTESGAIPSLLDYNDAGNNYYKRIGMISYPFYLLANQWGLETAYGVYISAARHCWQADMSLTYAANCIKQQTSEQQLPEQDVIDAFKAVKIALFEEGVLSHFTFQAGQTAQREVVFTDNSQSTSQVVDWQWDFGDGDSASEASPTHRYTTAGVYQVTLTVTDQSGDTDSFTREVRLSNQG